MKTYHVKKDDKVLVNAGNYRGSEATVKAVLAAKDRVVLEIAGEAAHKLGKRTVRISETRPISRNKCWRLVEIISRAVQE